MAKPNAARDDALSLVDNESFEAIYAPKVGRIVSRAPFDSVDNPATAGEQHESEHGVEHHDEDALEEHEHGARAADPEVPQECMSRLHQLQQRDVLLPVEWKQLGRPWDPITLPSSGSVFAVTQSGQTVVTEAGMLSRLDFMQGEHSLCIDVPEHWRRSNISGTARYFGGIALHLREMQVTTATATNTDSAATDTGNDMRDGVEIHSMISDRCVVQGIPSEVMARASQSGKATGGRNRVYGVDFVRIGLPKWSFAPVFNTLSSISTAATSNIVQSPTMYWVTAGWGTSPAPCQFTYRSNSGQSTETSQRNVHNLLKGDSALGTAVVTLRLSASNVDEVRKARQGDAADLRLGVTLHNFDCTAVGPFGGPKTSMVPTLAA